MRTLEERFQPDVQAPSAARHALRALAGGVPSTILDDVQLLVSELVTNSVRHAGLDARSQIRLQVNVSESAVRVEVSDPGPGFESPPGPPDMYQDNGWGLYLVEQVADRWGFTRDREMSVWFEMNLAR
jgi:anti-sigma regulatory factor (Ser/Thr protein kinase)